MLRPVRNDRLEMTKQRTAAVLTGAVLVFILGIGLGRTAGWSLINLRALTYKLKPTPPDPQDTIYAMFNAARSGDVQKYMAAYTGSMEASLRQSLAETGETAFSNYLIHSNTDVKGIAVADPQPVSESEVRIRVETIYQDRNEVQTMILEKVANTWKISRTDSEEQIKTLTPYGTPLPLPR